MNGRRCAHVWQPDNWATRNKDQKVTVVLNVWCDHVSSYSADVSCFAPDKPCEAEWAEHLLLTSKGDDDEHRYDDMLPFDWSQLLAAWHEKRAEVFWTTEPLDKLLEKGLHDHGLALSRTTLGPTSSLLSTCPFATASAGRIFASGACQKSTWSCGLFASACKTSCA